MYLCRYIHVSYVQWDLYVRYRTSLLSSLAYSFCRSLAYDIARIVLNSEYHIDNDKHARHRQTTTARPRPDQRLRCDAHRCRRHHLLAGCVLQVACSQGHNIYCSKKLQVGAPHTSKIIRPVPKKSNPARAAGRGSVFAHSQNRPCHASISFSRGVFCKSGYYFGAGSTPIAIANCSCARLRCKHTLVDIVAKQLEHIIVVNEAKTIFV